MNDLPFNLRKFKPHIKLPTKLNTRNFSQFQTFRTSPLNCSTHIYISNLPQKVNIRNFTYILNIPHSTSKLFNTHLHSKPPTKLHLQIVSTQENSSPHTTNFASTQLFHQTSTHKSFKPPNHKHSLNLYMQNFKPPNQKYFCFSFQCKPLNCIFF
jgi:hypothetical protein